MSPIASTTGEQSASDEPKRPGDISRRVAIVGIAAVLVVALALRFYGLSWDDGFSWTPHPDERAILMNVGELGFPSLGDLEVLWEADESPWNPGWFPYGSFPLYLLKAVQSSGEFLLGVRIEDLRTPGRAVSALADIATIALVYLLGAATSSRRTGLIAAGLVALAVLHIQLSHFFAVDTLLALSAVATAYFLVRVARDGRTTDSALAGVFIGLGLATKISIAPILASYLVAHLVFASGMSLSKDRRPASASGRISQALGGAMIGSAVILAVFFIAQPYALLDWTRFYADFVEQSEMVRRIRDYPYTRQYVDTTPYIYQVRQLITWGLGWPLGVVAWAGLVFVAVRGMGVAAICGYLVTGIVVPLLVLMASNSVAGILVASAFAVGSLVATMPARRADTRIDAVLLTWVVPYLLIIGAFDVKFMRYLLPVTPFLILFGSRMLVVAWDTVRRLQGILGRTMRTALVGLLAISAVATAFYAFSYTGVYRVEHPAVRASSWIRANLPERSVILKEHWEEGLPDLHRYRVRELEMYNPDVPAKFDRISSDLAYGDALVLYSNRLYGTLPRLPERYPVSREYYRLLFSGQLGYRLEAQFTAFPGLFGVALTDDTFGRPGLPAPTTPVGTDLSLASLNLGYADESFTVYDHPKVMVFSNVDRLDAETIQKRIESAAPGFPSSVVTRVRQPDDTGSQLMLTAEQFEAREAGGTWTTIVDTGGWVSRAPVVAWLIVVEGVAVLAFPIGFVVFRPLADRGWLLSKVLGLLLVGLVTWLLASLELMAFTRSAVSVGVAALFLAGVATLMGNRKTIAGFIRRHWKTIAVAETVFLVAFFAFLLIRAANPDLWHPFRGGEKPMDLAYLHAVLKSAYMPPYDPWFGEGYINYYYWGQFLVATLIHATGIVPEVAVNIAVPTFFAMTAALAFSLVFNMAAAAKVRGHLHGGVSPVVAGFGGALFVAVLGNLDGAVQVTQTAWRSVIQGLPAGEFDFWKSSRMMPPDPPGHEITEFPFFTFLFADPHAHLMALPFTLLCIGIALAIVLGMSGPRSLRTVWSPSHLLRIAMLGLAVGALRLLNAWDFPTYLLFGVAAVGLGEYLALGGLSLGVLLRSGLKAVIVFSVGYIAFLPYHLNYETFFNGIESTTNTTPLPQLLAIHGLFVFVIGTFLVRELRVQFSGALTEVGRWYHTARRAVTGQVGPDPVTAGWVQVGPALVVAVVTGMTLIGFLITALVSGSAWSTVLVTGALLLATSAVGLGVLAQRTTDAPITAFVTLAAGTAFALVIGLDFVRVEGDIDRMNSVFKFYLQVWVLLAICAAYMVWRMGVTSDGSPGKGTLNFRRAWLAVFAVLLLGAAVYPVLGTRDRLRDRFDGNVTSLTLDGVAYVDGTTYRDRNGPIDLEADFDGIRWLRENVQGSPIILEANTETYNWGGRVSIYTGLPSVVGWRWHQEQQRWGYRSQVARRIRDVDRIYSTTHAIEATALLHMYNVRYVYIGQLERLYYPEAGIAKFDDGLNGSLRLVHNTDSVSIYEVLN